MNKTVVVTIRMGVEMVGALDGQAEKDERSRSQVILRAVREWFKSRGIEVGTEGEVEVSSVLEGQGGRVAASGGKLKVGRKSKGVQYGDLESDVSKFKPVLDVEVEPEQERANLRTAKANARGSRYLGIDRDKSRPEDVPPLSKDAFTKAAGLCPHGGDPKTCRIGTCAMKRGK